MQPTSLAVTAAAYAASPLAPTAPALTLAADTRSVRWTGPLGDRDVMKADPREILEKSGDQEYLKAIIANSEKAPSQADANQIRIATLIYLAENIRRSGEASEQHARSLKFATWMLFGATCALVVVAFLQWLRMA